MTMLLKIYELDFGNTIGSIWLYILRLRNGEESRSPLISKLKE